MTTSSTRSAGSRAEIARYITLLEIEEVLLGLPQAEVDSLDTVLDLAPPTEAGAVGSIRRESDSWPVFCLSQDLVVMDYAPATRRICVLLKDRGRRLALLVDRVESVAEESVRPFPRTGTIARIPAPIRAFAEWDHRLVSLVSAPSLAGMARRQAAAIGTSGSPSSDVAEFHADES